MILKKLQEQKEFLISHEPELKTWFKDIFIEKYQTHIPFLPLRVFRHFKIISQEKIEDYFSSSGSTNIQSSCHYFSKESLKIYEEKSALCYGEFLKMNGFSSKVKTISFIPPPHLWRHSSLSFMIHGFKNHGFEILYFPLDENFEQQWNEIAAKEEELILFGTSFHYVQLAKMISSLRTPQKVGVIDTGGTKGRTEKYTPSQIYDFIYHLFLKKENIKILSEYGMCELASQAWSIHQPHDGHFQASSSLHPFVLDSSFQETSQEGFLAFIDEGNKDSYMALITEDLGKKTSSHTFELYGRSPLATLKGCSLRVTEQFSFEKPLSLPFKYLSYQRGSLWNGAFQEVIHKLSTFSSFEKKLLANMASFLDFKHLPPSFQEQEASCTGKNLRMIASNNIPITWIYPVCVASFLGYHNIVLQFPSLRPDDILSQKVLEQIKDLFDNIKNLLGNTLLHQSSRMDFHPQKLQEDVLLLFGSQDTCDWFAQNLPSHVTFLPMGDVKNAFYGWNEELLEAVCSWHGRGCLTPLATFVDSFPSFEEINSFMEKAEELLKEDLDLFSSSSFAHRHHLWEIQAWNPQAKIYSLNHIHLILTEIFPPLPLLENAGSGLLFVVLDSPSFEKKKKSLSFYKTQPTLLDTHMEKTWWEWLCLKD